MERDAFFRGTADVSTTPAAVRADCCSYHTPEPPFFFL